MVVIGCVSHLLPPPNVTPVRFRSFKSLATERRSNCRPQGLGGAIGNRMDVELPTSGLWSPCGRTMQQGAGPAESSRPGHGSRSREPGHPLDAKQSAPVAPCRLFPADGKGSGGSPSVAQQGGTQAIAEHRNTLFIPTQRERVANSVILPF